MPVTVRPTNNYAGEVHSFQQELDIKSIDRSILQPYARPNQKKYSLIQSSYKSSSTAKRINSSNGFVKAAIQAYCHHHHLQIRPDDIWMAMLTQFSAVVNAHAEELHDKFVEHEGKKKLILTYNAQSRHDFDFSIFAEDMGRVLEEEVKDPGLRDWLIPRFTTTTSNDVVVASIVMMATLQSYFSYESELMCGLPSVTLLGEKADYELILQPLDYLKQFGKAPTIFAKLLKPIIKSFITTFDEPTSSGTKRFWIRIASKIDRGSSGTGTGNDYSGWITAFCYWNEKGVAEYLPRKFKLGEACQEYFNISSDGVPAGYAIVPVVVTDNRQRVETVMVAGSLAIDCKNGYRTARVNTLQPELDGSYLRRRVWRRMRSWRWMKARTFMRGTRTRLTVPLPQTRTRTRRNTSKEVRRKVGRGKKEDA